ncbi:unnamed protein product [Paramecium pentaurelia]|uniref:Uncharacterized protein n=1 Tax=Paramecium pentaurelia TaxID=43138 RepID=A0A8S1YKS6_9CILI|nr:unnamed protein product [Paramecium pentaurelia]
MQKLQTFLLKVEMISFYFLNSLYNQNDCLQIRMQVCEFAKDKGKQWVQNLIIH